MLDTPAPSAGPVPLPDGTGFRPLSQREALEENLSGLLSAIRQRRAVLLATVVLIPLCAWLMLRQMTPMYTASGELIYEPNGYTVRELQSILRADPTTEAMMASQAELLQSLHIAQKVAERGHLFDDPTFNRSQPTHGRLHAAVSAISGWLGMETEEPEAEKAYGPAVDANRDQTLLAVQAALHAEPVRFSHVVQVTFTAASPKVAAAAVNNAMDAYIKEQYAAKHRAVDNANALLERQAGELRQEVRRVEERISAYRGEHGLNQGVHASTETERVTQLTEDLAKARAERAAADARLDAARGNAGAEAQAAVAPSVAQVRTQVEQLAAAMQAERGRLGSAHPEALSLAQQYAAGQRALASEIARVVAATVAEQHAAAERAAALEGMLKDSEADEQRADKAQIPLNAMQRDLDAARAQLQAVLDRMQQTAQQAAVESSEAHEISQALPPTAPSSPHVMQSMAGAIAASVFLGLLLVYVLHLADGTVRSGAELRLLTALSCLALIPEVGKRALGRLAIHDYVVQRPLSAFAEQIRSLRLAVSLDMRRPQVLAITAAEPGEAKSVTTLSLARSAQRGGEQVLTIECDVRQPSFEARLGERNRPGLMEVLRREAEWREVVREDPLTGMEYIPAGRPEGDALALFQSDEIRQLLGEARDQYSLILLDAPPVGAIAEARMVATIADAVLLCVRWRHTRAKTVQHALDMLRDAHATVMGAVLTRVEPHVHLRSGYADAAVYHRRNRAYFRG